MKKVIISVLGVLTIFSIVSCDKNNDISKPSLEKVVFSAGLDDIATKTQLVDGKKVHWTDGDKVAVFDNKSLQNVPFNATNINGATADFEGTLATEGVTSYVAVYPWTSSVRWSSGAGKYETTIPHYQKAVTGGFDTGLNLAAATTTSEAKHLSFKNMCALVKVTIPSDITDITALTLMSGEFLTGRVLFTFDAEGNPVMDKENSTDSGFKEVTLAEENGQPLASGDYYFVIRPSSSSFLSEGGVKHSFTVGATTVSGTVASIKSNVQIDVNANDVVNLGTLSLSKASKFRVTNAPVGDFPMGVEKFKIEYEGNDGAAVTFSQRNRTIATVDADGVVSFTGTVGVAHVFAVCNGVNYPLAFNITKGYYAENLESEAGSKWNIATSHINSGAKQKFVTDSKGNYIKCTPYLTADPKGRADLQRSGTTYLTREYPIICFRMDDVNDFAQKYARNITLDTSGQTDDGTNLSGGIGSNNNKWFKKYKCSDGSAILVYDLSKQGFGKSDGTNLLPEGQVGAFTTFQMKYADIKKGSDPLTADDIAYRFFWFRTFASTDALNAYLETWSKETGITYE